MTVLLALLALLCPAPLISGPPAPIDTPCAIGWERKALSAAAIIGTYLRDVDAAP